MTKPIQVFLRHCYYLKLQELSDYMRPSQFNKIKTKIMIKTYINVLDKDLIKNIFDYLKNIQEKDVWGSSSSWDQDLIKNSSSIMTHTIREKYLVTKIKNNIENKIQIKFEEVGLNFICFVIMSTFQNFCNLSCQCFLICSTI